MFYYCFQWQDWTAIDGANTRYVYENYATPPYINVVTVEILTICYKKTK